jgi:hypothetical protein
MSELASPLFPGTNGLAAIVRNSLPKDRRRHATLADGHSLAGTKSLEMISMVSTPSRRNLESQCKWLKNVRNGKQAAWLQNR